MYTLTGDHHSQVEQVFVKPVRVQDYHIVSSDLTSATDLLPHDLIRVIVETIIEVCQFPEWAAIILRRLTGP
jgi:hypothetical protein